MRVPDGDMDSILIRTVMLRQLQRELRGEAGGDDIEPAPQLTWYGALNRRMGSYGSGKEERNRMSDRHRRR